MTKQSAEFLLIRVAIVNHEIEQPQTSQQGDGSERLLVHLSPFQHDR